MEDKPYMYDGSLSGSEQIYDKLAFKVKYTNEEQVKLQQEVIKVAQVSDDVVKLRDEKLVLE